MAEEVFAVVVSEVVAEVVVEVVVEAVVEVKELYMLSVCVFVCLSVSVCV